MKLYLLWSKMKFHNFINWKEISLIFILKKKLKKNETNKKKIKNYIVS